MARAVPREDQPVHPDDRQRMIAAVQALHGKQLREVAMRCGVQWVWWGPEEATRKELLRVANRPRWSKPGLVLAGL